MDARPPSHVHMKPRGGRSVARYIDYNVQKLAKPGSIARHADNDSMVTMVVSDSGDQGAL